MGGQAPTLFAMPQRSSLGGWLIVEVTGGAGTGAAAAGGSARLPIQRRRESGRNRGKGQDVSGYGDAKASGLRHAPGRDRPPRGGPGESVHKSQATKGLQLVKRLAAKSAERVDDQLVEHTGESLPRVVLEDA